MESKIKLIRELYAQWAGEEAINVAALPPSGSYREYYRITGRSKNAMGVFNADIKENKAFLSYSQHFLRQGLLVPQIYAEDKVGEIYLIEDLGDITLHNRLQEIWTDQFPDEAYNLYKTTLTQLLKIQLEGGKDLDYSVAYPRAAFDRQSMMWDLNYFKYQFLKIVKAPFEEEALENDFNKLIEYLLTADCSHFLFRDFQSRNIMISKEKIYFIDYQGGRKGALHYDVASLLYEAKTHLPQEVREELLEFYISELKTHIAIDEIEFRNMFYAYALIRTLQAMGAYGFRGLVERKTLFIQSIPPAIRNLNEILEKLKIKEQIPSLVKTLYGMMQADGLREILRNDAGLTIIVNSFSFKRGLPYDINGNGGGFVFDCRLIHNPGRFEQYKKRTGMDSEVIAFFATQAADEVKAFGDSIKQVISQAIVTYKKRGYTNLMINFGCTGGQHRSVFFAEMMAEYIKSNFEVNVVKKHLELNK